MALAGAGLALGVGIYALARKRRSGTGRGAEDTPSPPQPRGGAPDADAAREIAGEPTSPQDVPSAPAGHGSSGPAAPVNEAMEEIAGEPTSPADVPGAEPPTEVRRPEPHHALNTPVEGLDPDDLQQELDD